MTCTVTGDPDRECGVFCWKPKFMQCFANAVCFTIFYCPTALLTSGLSVYISSQVTTLEKQFGFSSSESGFLLSCNDIGYLLTTLIASFIARKVHIPRSMSLSTIFYGISGIVCSFAFFLSPENKLKAPAAGMACQTLQYLIFSNFCCIIAYLYFKIAHLHCISAHLHCIRFSFVL